MKELPTLPPAADAGALDSAASATDSAASQRPVLPVDADLEVSAPKAPDRRESGPSSGAQNANTCSPFVIEGNLAKDVDPFPVPPAMSND